MKNDEVYSFDENLFITYFYIQMFKCSNVRLFNCFIVLLSPITNIMKHIQNFYVNTQPGGNELKWVGTTKNNSHFEILRSTDELDFETIETLDLKAVDSKEFQFFDKNGPRRAFYQVKYFEGEEEIDVSPVFKVLNEKRQFKWVPFVIRAIIAIILIGGVMTLVKRLTAPKPPEDIKVSAPNVSAVKLKTVQYQNYSTTIEALGKVVSTSPIDVVSEVSGRILKGDVTLRTAMSFQKDALLFAIDKQESILNLKSQRSNFQNAIAMMLADLKLDFPDEFKKWNSYFLNLSIDRSLTALPTTNSNREKTYIATKNILGQYYAIKSAEERLTKYEVRAPYNGIITQVYTDAGSVANPGTPVVRIRRNGQLELELPIRKEDIQWIRVGTNVKLFSEDKSQSTTGRIVRISNTMDASTQSINAYVSISGSRFKIYEGMYMAAELSGRAVSNAMEISRKAVVEDSQVFVMLSDSTIQQKTIKIHKVNTETVLFSGLQAGEQVVNDNLLGLADGVKIIPLK